MSNNQITRQSVVSNIEVYRCLNPLYYSIFDGELDNTKSFEIFKNLNNNSLISLEQKIKEIFKSTYDLSSINNSYVLNNSSSKAFKELFHNSSQIFDNSTNDKKINLNKLFNIFYANNHFVDDYLTDTNTLFIYLDTYESDNSLTYPQISQSSQIKVINEAFKFKSKDQEIKNENDNDKITFIEKRSFKIRVYSKNKNITKESIKQSIDIDIQNIKTYIETYNPKSSENKIEKIRIITDFDGNLDFHALNINKIKNITERKKLFEMVDYTNDKLKELFSSELKTISKESKVIGKVNFFVYPSIQQPYFIDKNISNNEFYSFFKSSKIKKQIEIQRKIIFNNVNEFKKILQSIKEKIINGQKIESLGDFIKDFYKLELYIGNNGDNLINITKDVHDNKFRFKKGNKVFLSMPALDVELIGSIRGIKPTGFYHVKILANRIGNEELHVADIYISIDYQNDKNTFKIEKFEFDPEKQIQTKAPEDIDSYKSFFKITEKDNKLISQLIKRSGTIKRKTAIPKHVLSIEPSNLINTTNNKPIFIIPLISFDDNDIKNFLKINDDKYIIKTEDLLNILIDNEKSYKFYLSVSMNDPKKVFDKDEYSISFKEQKIKQNVDFIISKLLQKGNTFRQKIIDTDRKKEFKGIYKILNYKLNNNIDIINKKYIDQHKDKSYKEVEGILVEINNNLFLQIYNTSSFVSFDFVNDVSKRMPPKNKNIKLIDESIKDSYKLITDDYKKNIFIATNIVSEFSNPNLHNEKIIRTQIQLFITQNPPKDFSDYDCEIKKHKLREVFKTFKDKIPLLQSFETQLPPGFYLKEQYV